MSKIIHLFERIILLCLAFIWLYFALHFGMGQATVITPKWEHYVIEGYFLFSFSIVTYLLVAEIKIATKKE